MTRAGLRAPALALALAVGALAGCAARPPAPTPAPSPPAASSAPTPAPTPAPSAPPGAPVGTTASGGQITIHPPPAPAVVDSAPSEDALAVLRTIPEPIEGRVADERAGIPVPAPTLPLGDRPGTRATATLPESLATPAVPPPAAAPAAPRSAAAGSPDSCWRVQVLAPPERERADRMAEAARSQLRVPFVVEREGGLFKVRSRDCLGATAADDLRRRALASGFEGAFRFRGTPR